MRYEEFSLDSVKTKNKNLKKIGGNNDFQFNLLELAWAHAHTQIVGSLLHRPLLEWSSSLWTILSMSIYFPGRRTLILSDRFRNYYRDFSKTAKIGELGQSISYLFYSKMFKYHWIGDVHGFFEEHRMPGVLASFSRKKVSDYLLTDGNRSMTLECKGTLPPPHYPKQKVKQKLKEGLEQTESLKKILNRHRIGINKQMATVFRAACFSDPFNPVLFYVDPDSDVVPPERFISDIQLYHYARWILLGVSKVKYFDPELLYPGGFKELRRMFKIALELFPAEKGREGLLVVAELKVDDISIRYLIRRDVLIKLSKNQLISNFEVKNKTEAKMALQEFPDGTAIVVESHPLYEGFLDPIT